MLFDVKDEVKKLKAYTVEPDRPKTMLDANENPFELPDYIIENIRDRIDYHGLNRYPDARASKLCSKLASYVGYGMTADNIMVGDGSDELINIIISGYLSKGSSILLPVPGFSMYNIYSSINEGKVIQYDRDTDFKIDMGSMICEVKKIHPSLVFLCNPNNPTGTLTEREDIIKLLENCDCMVVVDEAYYEFAGISVVDLIDKYENLIVLRTLSKAWGLAGIRLGYLISNKKVVDELLKVKSPFNVNTLTQEIAAIMLDYTQYMNENVKTLIEERKYLTDALFSLNKIKVFETHANFILLKVPDADDLSSKLKESGIAIRNFNGHNGLSNCIRISVGTRGENSSLIDIIKNAVGE